VAFQDKHFEQQIRLPMTLAILGLVGFIGFIAILMLLGDHRREVTPEAYGSRSGYDQMAAPASKVLAAPAHLLGDSGNFIGDYLFAVDENRVLKKKVAQLSQYRDLYLQMKDINQRYEKLLNLRTEPPVDMVTARSVSVSRGPFNNNRLIDAGSNKGIAFNNPVITEQGLVGRVIGVSSNVSRVLMITDVISRVPIMIARSDARAIMIGEGGDYPRLEFVRGKESVIKGDQILSSGDGGIFPRGLPIGEAVKGPDGVWRVRLYANRGAIDYVKILKFQDFSQFPNADELLKYPSVTTVLPPPPVTIVKGAFMSSSAVSTVSAIPAGTALTRAQRPIAPPRPKPEITKPEPTLRPYVPSAPSSATATDGSGASSAESPPTP
jgi:rod shape-determining protein MreC